MRQVFSTLYEIPCAKQQRGTKIENIGCQGKNAMIMEHDGSRPWAILQEDAPIRSFNSRGAVVRRSWLRFLVADHLGLICKAVDW